LYYNSHADVPWGERLTIRNYSDHAANERTFLAWVRTSVAITAFGFLVERFDLFIALATQNRVPLRRTEFGVIAGLVLIIVGVMTVILATFRFIRTAREIDREQVMAGPGSRLDIALATLLATLGIALVFYLYRAVSL
jgi:putative membrane protein